MEEVSLKLTNAMNIKDMIIPLIPLPILISAYFGIQKLIAKDLPRFLFYFIILLLFN